MRYLKHLLVCTIVLHMYFALSAQPVTQLITDYGGYWKSGIGALNATVTNNSHNLLAFQYAGVVYSTGVNDATLTANAVSYTSGSFEALPFSSIGGTVTSAGSTYISLGTQYDGVTNGASTPFPSLRIRDVLTDGIKGLNIGTGVTNIPNTARVTFPVTISDVNKISDSEPDVVFTQTAQPTGAGDIIYFQTAAGALVGNQISVTWTAINLIGSQMVDLYTMNNVSCDLSVINGFSLANQPKDIRMVAYKLSEFGITADNAATVAKMIIQPGGQSDPAFIAYNTNVFSISVPVIITQPVTQTICPGTSQPVTFSVVVSGTNLTYQWYKNTVAILGATSATLTITNVTASDAGTYEVRITNSAGTAISNIAYLNTVITAQPIPVSQTIATGNSVTLSVTANNATGYQWKKDGTNISGATTADYIINPVTTTSNSVYTVNALNAASGGCASAVSSGATIIPSSILYSKSSGNLNLVSNWGVSSDGSGSNPVNFLRGEHTFIVSNRTAAATSANLTIAGTLDIANTVTTITAGTTLNTGKIISSGTGTLTGSAASNLTISGSGSTLYFTQTASGTRSLNNLTFTSAANATLGNAVDVFGTVGLTAATFNVNAKNLTLKSTSAATARIANLTGSTLSNATNITAERYIFSKSSRRFSFISAPVNARIDGAWQQQIHITGSPNGTTPGTKCADGSSASQPTQHGNGFDASQTLVPSMYRYGQVSTSGSKFISILGTNGDASITDGSNYLSYGKGYRVNVRGPRSLGCSLLYNTPDAPAAVTLSATGTVGQGLITLTNQIAEAKNPGAAQYGYSLLGNPYPCEISFSAFRIANSSIISNSYWTFFSSSDQASVSNYSVYNNGTSVNFPSVIADPGIISSGQSFFVEKQTAGIGSVQFLESHKSGTAQNGSFRPQGSGSYVRIGLKQDSARFDEIVIRFKPNGVNSLDNNFDALSLNSGDQVISSFKGLKKLAIQTRNINFINDTVNLSVTSINNGTYQLKFSEFENFSAAQIYLADNFLNTVTLINNKPIYNFHIDANAASQGNERFKVIFKSLSVLPVDLITVKAYEKNAGITVEWTTVTETNIKHYEVQKSVDAQHFKMAAAIAAKINGATASSYNWFDSNANNGANYYRIKKMTANGDIKYSEVVKVNTQKVKPELIVYPNPVKNNLLSLQINNAEKGNYNLSLFNSIGQKLYHEVFKFLSPSTKQTIKLPANLSKGTYHVRIDYGRESIAKNIYVE